MIDELSIEYLKNSIFSKNTSQYFEEVYSSYTHGNYRSSVVMLWSVVVLDIVEKLQILKNVYGDDHAKSILREINGDKQNDQKSSIWELKIIEEVSKRTELINSADYLNLKQIQEQRHLSAHPIIRDPIELHSPNKDTARALIRNALEVLLTKPPIYARQIIRNIQDDLTQNRNYFENDQEALEKFIKNKYLEKMSSKTKTKIYRSFWKFVMHLDNENVKINREVNFRFLKILAKDDLQNIIAAMESEPSFYSKLDSEYQLMTTLIDFLSEVPEVYNTLSEDVKMLIEKRISYSNALKLKSYFRHSSLQEHYTYLEQEFESERLMNEIPFDEWEKLRKLSDSKETDRRFAKLLGLHYSNSGSFDMADRTCNTIIRLLGKLTIEDIACILEQAEGNSQTHGRGRAPHDYKIIKAHILKIDSDFDLDTIPNFKSESA